jgi:hypothetical protein
MCNDAQANAKITKEVVSISAVSPVGDDFVLLQSKSLTSAGQQKKGATTPARSSRPPLS